MMKDIFGCIGSGSFGCRGSVISQGQEESLASQNRVTDVDILFVPSVRKGNGSGHLARCFNLAMELGDKAGIYLPDDPGPDCWGAAQLRLAYPVECSKVQVVTSIPPGAGIA
jgi:hypothetical protein